ncbi:hypothetical protein FisN_26Lh112 [Fistulifera solaris]|uniref:Uncharacterized protein n=1 Tax=Fistulifera solaris TaxID=1519565 RepID=A0A1Z5KD69_FISSO|nr:hypothetical protein FisN_26Lh112 [Fistulifera solaris]|eukprot:GAX24041.1 hypothetical protein FisN_26Lh112 [Fistulifera solaris]
MSSTRKRDREEREKEELGAKKRSPVVSCHDSQSPAEESPRDDTVILSKSSLESSKSYEWFSSQVSTPVPAEPTLSVAQGPAPPNLDPSVAYSSSSRDSHRHATLTQQQQQQQQPPLQSFNTRSPPDMYSYPDQNSPDYAAVYPQSHHTHYHHHHQYTSRQPPYVDYTPYREQPYVAPVQQHYSYPENVAYHHHHSPPIPPAAYYNYSYPPPPEYNYYPPYYPSDPCMYNTGVSTSYMKPETILPSHHAPSSDDPRLSGIPLYLPCDEATLSAYQCLVRQQIEFFAASPMDVEQTIQGRNKKIEPGQVGIRCRHCKHIPIKRRARGAMYYPSKLSCIYQMAQNMASVHTSQACEHVPTYIREQMEHSISDRKSLAGSGKEYWATGARSVGVTEQNGRLMFVPKM